ncbi:phage integrase central domain-containing protein [Brucella oryzae]|uniref:phage integrase central domain-containing protein n=1 Tax=Brucella oryzae TaxID=335286 RepID=UPI00404158CF
MVTRLSDGPQHPRHAPLSLRTLAKAEIWQPKLAEITHEDLRALADAIVERGAPATAVLCREVVMQVFRWAIERGQKVENPADLVRPSTIAKFKPRDRALAPDEIAFMYQYMERIGTTPSIRVAAKLLLCQSASKRAPLSASQKGSVTKIHTAWNTSELWTRLCCEFRELLLSENGFAVAKTPCCLRIM